MLIELTLVDMSFVVCLVTNSSGYAFLAAASAISGIVGSPLANIDVPSLATASPVPAFKTIQPLGNS